MRHLVQTIQKFWSQKFCKEQPFRHLTRYANKPSGKLAEQITRLVIIHKCQNSARRPISDLVTPQIRDVTGQKQTYTYVSEALTY